MFIQLALSGQSLAASGAVVIPTVQPGCCGVAEPLKRELPHGYLVTVDGAGTVLKAVDPEVLQAADHFGQRFVVREVLKANGP